MSHPENADGIGPTGGARGKNFVRLRVEVRGNFKLRLPRPAEPVKQPHAVESGKVAQSRHQLKERFYCAFNACRPARLDRRASRFTMR